MPPFIPPPYATRNPSHALSFLFLSQPHIRWSSLSFALSHPLTSMRSLLTIFIRRLRLPREQPRPLFRFLKEETLPVAVVDPPRYRCVNSVRQTLALTRNFHFYSNLPSQRTCTGIMGKRYGILREISTRKSPLRDLGRMLWSVTMLSEITVFRWF